MKFSTLAFFCFALLCITSFTSCVKDIAGENDDPCKKLAQLHAHAFTSVSKGEEIEIEADYMEDVFYTWRGPGTFESNNYKTMVSSYAEYYDRGWYYITMSYPDCTTKVDSVFVTVKFPQGNPTCTPANNSANFSSLGDQMYSFISFGAQTGGYGATCNSSNGDLQITMSSYWASHDMEDGIYSSSSDPLPEYADIDKVFISCVNQSIYWVAEPDKPVYISHVGGKICITFCGIDFSGSLGGPTYHTVVDAKITQP